MGNHECYLYNDTDYHVTISDYDGTRSLSPGDTQHNYLLKGGNYHISLIMKFPDYGTKTIKFHDYEYQNETHRMSTLFSSDIQRYEEVVERRRMKEEGRCRKETDKHGKKAILTVLY